MMTLNDLECPIHPKVRLVDGLAFPPFGQLTRCFSEVAIDAV